MKLIASLALCALVGGCALTPADLRQQGQAIESKSARAPGDVANCFARNAENLNYMARVSTGTAQGSFEALAYVGRMDGLNAAAVMEARPSGAGSTIKTWENPTNRAGDKTPETLLKGC